MRRINGATRVAGVVGWPVAHSLSPLIHNAWLDAAGLDGVYVPFAVPPEGFAAFVEGLSSGVVAGLNVTVPHKQAAYELAHDRRAEARRAEAANVLLFEDGKVIAHNTDGEGMLNAIEAACPGLRCLAGPVVVLGAGGGASAAISTLEKSGASEVRIVARRLKAAEEWVTEGLGYRAFGMDDLSDALSGSQLVVNATSAGLNGVGELPSTASAPPEAVFMDMVYSPLRTRFLAEAAARGHRTVDGLAMLIGQARPSFEAFFGVPAPSTEQVDVRALCLAALGEA